MGEFPSRKDMFTTETSSEMGRRGGEAKAKPVRDLKEVRAELGPLETISDAQHWLFTLALWGAAGQINGSILSACIRAVEIWIRAHSEGQAEEVKTDLERKIKKLERESRKRRVA